MKSYRFLVIVLMLCAIFSTSMPSINSEENSDIEVEVMINFGNGIVEWSQVNLGTNRTAINATQKACEKLDLDITVIWSQWGAFVSKIDGKPLDYSWWWWFIIWNDTQEKWEGSMVGASSVDLKDGDVIGWSANSSKPLATPYAKHPWPAFQNNAMNLGVTESNGPETNAVEWIFDTETKELASSPVIALNKVVINNWGGTFCLNEEGELLWRNSEVKGVFSPTLGHGKVLVGGKDGYLYSLNITNGEILWKTKITNNPGLSGVTSPAKIVNGRIYLGSFDFNGETGYLNCIGEEDGQILWKNSTLSSIYFSSPSVTENRVFVGTMGLYNSTTLQWQPPYGVFCFDVKNGEPIWNFSVNDSVGSSPTIMDDKVFFTSKNGYLYCLDSISGDLAWKKNIGNSVSSPAILPNKIFVGSGEMNNEGKFYRLDMNGEILWEFEPNGAVQSSPAVAGNFVYFATNVQNGTIYCLNISNGKLVWKYKPWPAQYIISSPAIVEGKLFIASDNGRLYCLGGESKNITVDDTKSTVNIYTGEDVKFLHKDKENKLTITCIEENMVILRIEPLLPRVEINVGETKELDTDNNGKKDLSIIVNNVDISSQSASLTFNTLTEPQDEGVDVTLISVLAFIIIIIFIALGIIINLKRRK